MGGRDTLGPDAKDIVPGWFGPRLSQQGPHMAIDHYDPLSAPDAEQWLALDETARLLLVMDYHTRNAIELPNERLHAALHVTIENQIALGDATPVREKARQLMAQGLDRHQAVHAIISVLIKYLYGATPGRLPANDPNQRYYAALRRLNARQWLRSG